MKCSAILSYDGKYRYKLERIWQPECQPIVWIMLNPSKADANLDDPTIRRCIGFSMNWGYGAIEVYNLFAWRATCPDNLVSATDPIGPENDHWLKSIPKDRQIIAAWGKIPEALGRRDTKVLQLLTGMHVRCLGLTMTGFPRHPVRLAYNAKPETYPA
jgi:hypothetical protein